MDRKGIRNQKHTSDGKKRNRPPNRFEMENSVENRSTSAKKLKACHTDVIIDQSISYRILNIFTFLSAVCEHVSCKTCGGDIKFEESSTRGLGFKLGLMCANCDAKYIDSCPLIRNAYEINTRFIFAMRLLGVGLQGAEKFCAFMDLPRPVFHSFYDSVVKRIRDAAKTVCDYSLYRSGKEEMEKTAEAENVAEPTGLTVSGDGSWKKRGFSSLFGIASLIGYYTNKVLDVIIKSSYCRACVYWEKKNNSAEYEEWLESHQAECSANHKGSAGKMEVDGICDMFKRSETLHNKYINYIGDGDSRTYKGIIESYDSNVKKKECINHVQKRMGARLRVCKKNNKGLGGRGKLTGKLIDELSAYYGLAIRRNANSVDDMYKAVWATLYHKTSTDKSPKHHYCPEGADSWCTWQKSKANNNLDQYIHKTPLHKDVVVAITPIYEDLSDKELLKKCLGGFTQNNNESFNALVWKFAPKTLSSEAVIVHLAAYLATILFNDGHTGLLRILEHLNVKIGPTAAAYRDKQDALRISAADRKAQAATYEGRLRRRCGLNEEEDNAADLHDLFYGPGVDAL